MTACSHWISSLLSMEPLAGTASVGKRAVGSGVIRGGRVADVRVCNARKGEDCWTWTSL